MINNTLSSSTTLWTLIYNSCGKFTEDVRLTKFLSVSLFPKVTHFALRDDPFGSCWEHLSLKPFALCKIQKNNHKEQKVKIIKILIMDMDEENAEDEISKTFI